VHRTTRLLRMDTVEEDLIQRVLEEG